MKTTISLSVELKAKIAEFKQDNESFESVLQRLYDLACEHQLRTLLLSTRNTMPIEQALEESKKKWLKT